MPHPRSHVFDLQDPVNSEPGICIFQEQRYNSSRCFLISSCYSCKNAGKLLE